MLNNGNIMHFDFANFPQATASANYMASMIGDLGYVVHVTNTGSNKMFYVFPYHAQSKDAKLSIMRFELNVSGKTPYIKFDFTHSALVHINMPNDHDFHVMAAAAAKKYEGIELTDYRDLPPEKSGW